MLDNKGSIDEWLLEYIEFDFNQLKMHSVMHLNLATYWCVALQSVFTIITNAATSLEEYQLRSLYLREHAQCQVNTGSKQEDFVGTIGEIYPAMAACMCFPGLDQQRHSYETSKTLVMSMY